MRFASAPTLLRECLACGLTLIPLVTGAQGPLVFTDVTDRTGIDFRHTDGSSGRHYLVESFSGGVALLDYDQDGDLDVYLLNGAALPGAKVDRPPESGFY